MLMPIFRLKKRGLDITEAGVSVKTNKRLDRDDYLAATGRCVNKSIAAAASDVFI